MMKTKLAMILGALLFILPKAGATTTQHKKRRAKKRMILSALFALFCLLPAAAQQWRFGIEAGCNWTHYRNDKSFASQVGNMGGGFQVEGTVDYEFKNHWMLMSGLTLMKTQSNMKLYNSMMPYFPDTEIKMGHLNIPLQVGYSIQLSKNLSLIPQAGFYGSINFNIGKCDVMEATTEDIKHWKPMDGYTYIIPSEDTYDVNATISPFRHWNWGAIGGLKAVIANHYTVSLQYYESLKKVQKQCNLRNYGVLLNVGYRF